MDSKLLNTIDQIEVDTINITHVQTSLFIYCRATPFFGWIHHGQSAFPICIYLLSYSFNDDFILTQLHWFTPMFQTKMPKVQRSATNKDAIHAWLKVYAQSNSQQERLL